jgi:hypothetical protein
MIPAYWFSHFEDHMREKLNGPLHFWAFSLTFYILCYTTRGRSIQWRSQEGILNYNDYQNEILLIIYRNCFFSIFKWQIIDKELYSYQDIKYEQFSQHGTSNNSKCVNVSVSLSTAGKISWKPIKIINKGRNEEKIIFFRLEAVRVSLVNFQWCAVCVLMGFNM